MNILFMVVGPKKGGVATFANIFKHTDKEETYEYFYFKSAGKRIHNIMKILLIILDLFRFCYILIVKKIDLIFLNPSLGKNSIRRDGLYALIANFVKIKIYIHWHGWNREDEYLLNDIFCRKGLYKADHIRVLSQEFMSKIKDSGFKNKMTLGNTMIDYELISCSDSLKERSNNGIKLLYLAMISKNKGVFETLKIFEKLQKKYPKIELYVAGKGPELNQFLSYINKYKLPNIVFLGYVEGSKKIKAFENADIYILPSYFEGMPTSVLEAMYFGLPVICTLVGGLHDFFIPGKMGFTIEDPKDIDSFVSAIDILITDPSLRINISKFNHDYSRDHFLPETTVREIENEIKNI